MARHRRKRNVCPKCGRKRRGSLGATIGGAVSLALVVILPLTSGAFLLEVLT